MYSDYMWSATFNASKSLIPVVLSICSDCDHACDATFIVNSTSKSLISVHSSMYSDCGDNMCNTTFTDNSASKSCSCSFLNM